MIVLRSILYFTAAVFVFLFFFSFARRRNQLATLFSLEALAVIVYAVGYAFELGSTSAEEVRFWLKFEYFGLPFIPAFWFLLTYKANSGKSPPFYFCLAVLAIPALTLFFSATNDYHHFHYRNVSINATPGGFVAQLDKGPWYYVFVVYSNLIMAVTLVVFFLQWKKSGLGRESRSFWMMLGSLLVIVFELLYLFGFSPYNIDLTALGLFGAALFQAVAIFRFDFLKSDAIVKDIVFSGISEGILTVDAKGRISDFNAAGAKIFPWLSPDCIGKKLADFKDGSMLDFRAGGRRDIKISRDEKTRYFSVRATDLVDKGKNAGKVYMFKDVTTRRRVMRTLYRFANYDTLTKVFNRRRLFDDAEREIARIARYGQRVALLMLDLDHFKVVNDQYGHQAGDAVLVEVSRVLKKRIRAADILGRYGGEEFLILLV
ncbi:MAG TPA: histidine kinase N-terminal 7TM domain-containing protein, partial [Rectinemataceae bacterium]|nr:histidine kinase N-terminal 7TM domain-containing protein [Rectinemataceae bacterium]